MTFITLTNSFNGVKYKINPKLIEMIYSQDEATYVVCGTTQVIVKESENEVLNLINETKEIQ